MANNTVIKKCFKEINETTNRLSKGLVTKFGNDITILELGWPLNSRFYNKEEYDKWLMDISLDIDMSVTQYSLTEFHHLRREYGIVEEYACVSK